MVPSSPSAPAPSAEGKAGRADEVTSSADSCVRTDGGTVAATEAASLAGAEASWAGAEASWAGGAGDGPLSICAATISAILLESSEMSSTTTWPPTWTNAE